MQQEVLINKGDTTIITVDDYMSFEDVTIAQSDFLGVIAIFKNKKNGIPNYIEGLVVFSNNKAISICDTYKFGRSKKLNWRPLPKGTKIQVILEAIQK